NAEWPTAGRPRPGLAARGYLLRSRVCRSAQHNVTANTAKAALIPAMMMINSMDIGGSLVPAYGAGTGSRGVDPDQCSCLRRLPLLAPVLSHAAPAGIDRQSPPSATALPRHRSPD